MCPNIGPFTSQPCMLYGSGLSHDYNTHDQVLCKTMTINTIVLTNSSLIELLSLFGIGVSSANTTQFAMMVAKIKISNAVKTVKEF